MSESEAPKLYILYDYDEDGPDRIKATLHPDRLENMVRNFYSNFADPEKGEEFICAMVDRLQEFISKNKDVVGEYPLSIGWGSPIIMVLELE